MNKIELTAIGRPRATSIAGVLVGLLLVQLPGTAAGPGHARIVAKTLDPAKKAWQVAQVQAVQKSADPQLTELIGQADALKAKGAYAEAALLWQQILAIVEKEVGPEHPSTALSLNNLAELFWTQGAYAKAESLLLRAQTINEKVLEPDNPIIAASLNNLATLYYETGNYDKAEPLFIRALAIREKTLGPDHRSTSISLRSLAYLYMRQGAYVKAEPLFVRALAISEKAPEPASLDTANSLTGLATLYTYQGAFVRAEPLYLRALSINEKLLGPNHPETGTALNNLAVLYSDQGVYAKAEPLLLRALLITEKTLGLAHPSTATSLNNLALLYSDQGAYAKAESLYLRALEINQKALGPNHPSTATSLSNLAGLYKEQGAYAKAEPLYLRALTISEKALGEAHPNTATIINNLATLYTTQGAYSKAETYYLRSLAITEKAKGPDHHSTATSLNNIAQLYVTQGAYTKAEPLFLRALAIKEKALGEAHPDTATTINNLATLYSTQGAYAKAEPLYLRALANSEKALGPDHPDIASTLNNLAGLYYYQGVYAKAEPLLLRALTITEKALGPAHPSTATSLYNLGVLYRNQGAYTKAEPFFLRALAISEKMLKADHSDTANNLIGLAELYKSQGAFAKAEPLLFRALAINEKALGPEHPMTAVSLINLAVLYDNLGAYSKAEPLHLRALNINEKQLGPNHPQTAVSLINLAFCYRNQGSYAKADQLLQRLNRAQSGWLRRELPLRPRELRGSLIDTQPDAPAITFDLLDQFPAAAPLALETRLNRQGLLAEIERRQASLKASSSQTRLLAEQVAAIDRQLSSSTLPPAQREPLRQQRQQLETQLYQLLPTLKINAVSTAQVAAALNSAAPQGLLVEFQKYKPILKGKAEWGPPRYVALLLRPDGTIRSIPLGAAAPIDTAIAEAVAASADPKRQADAPVRLAAVSQLVLQPLRAELAGVRELFISPDGELNRLPFAALPVAAATGPTLAESVQLRLLTSGRELVRLQQPAPGANPTTLITNPDFGPADSSARVPQSNDSTLRGLGPWLPLPGTIAEAEQLSPLLRPQALISGRQATAALVLQQRSPRILHIATHGFFLADQSPPTPRIPQAGPSELRGPVSGPVSIAPYLAFEPLQRSGLVFAGANQPTANPNDDGYLTAAEAAAMDLSGTELVTLSACDTALGGIRSGEGVYGLQRALAVAGARSTLLSLWKVDDARTATFLALFYQRLKAGEGRAEALRHTQSFFRTNKDTNLRDVRVWGAFQLSGDWRPIQGL